MLLAHKIALDPNAAQRIYFARARYCALCLQLGAGRVAEAVQGRRPAFLDVAEQAIERDQARTISLDVRCHQVRCAGGDHRSRHGVPGVLREARQVPTVQE